MPASWSPSDINRLIAVVTGCLCLPVLVGGVLLLIAQGALSAELLGSATGVGVGGGVLGLAAIVAMVIRLGLSKGDGE